MAGRGYGKASMSFTIEQLGLTKAEAVMHLILEPPPKYPILEYKPLPFTITNEMSYLLELKRDYSEYLKESPFNVQPIEVKKDVERYSDRFQDLMTDKSGYETKYDWSKLPAELKPSSIRKKEILAALPKKKQKIFDIVSKLEELEKKEINQQGHELESEEEKVEGEEEEKEISEDEIDEEMDEGTDYVNSYFDNGEDYDDDEDNMDDGAIY